MGFLLKGVKIDLRLFCVVYGVYSVYSKILKSTIAKVQINYNLTLDNLNPVYSLVNDILLTNHCTFLNNKSSMMIIERLS